MTSPRSLPVSGRNAPLQPRTARLVFVGLLVSGLLGACAGAPKTYVNFEDAPRVDEQEVQTAPSHGDEVRFAIAPVLSPAGEVDRDKLFARYLEQHLGKDVQIVRRRTYAEINDLVQSGAVDAALVCGGAYVEGALEFGMQALVASRKFGQPFYSSYLIVPADSPAEHLADLEGGSFAFTDPLSNSGRLVPLFEVSRLGNDPEGFFGTTLFTNGHDNSIHAVVDGLVDGAAVDSWVYEDMVAAQSEVRDRTKILERWGPFGAPPVVVGPAVDPELRDQLRSVLLGMSEDPSARPVLDALGLDGFSPMDPELYAGVERVSDVVGGRTLRG